MMERFILERKFPNGSETAAIMNKKALGDFIGKLAVGAPPAAAAQSTNVV